GGRIFQKGLGELRGVLLHGDAVARGVANDLVVDVGDIHDVADVVSTLAQKAIEKIDGDECTEIADVAVVINGRPAGIHADAVAVDRMEVFDLPGESVIEAQWHRDAESWMSSRAEYEPFILGARWKRGQIGCGERK